MEMTRALLAPIPFREVFVILALFLPQLTFVEGAKPASRLWASPAIQRNDYEVQVTPLAQGLRGMHEYHIAFPAWSNAAAFCHLSLPAMESSQLIEKPFDEVHIGCQVGKVYRIVLEEAAQVYAILVVLLEFVPQARRKTRRDAPRAAQRQVI